MEPRPRKLLDQVRDVIHIKHYSYRTEESDVAGIRRFILFHNKRYPIEMRTAEIGQFLSDRAIQARVTALAQTQALSV